MSNTVAECKTMKVHQSKASNGSGFWTLKAAMVVAHTKRPSDFEKCLLSFWIQVYSHVVGKLSVHNSAVLPMQHPKDFLWSRQPCTSSAAQKLTIEI